MVAIEIMNKLGPYELNNIYCGECSQMMAALPDNCIDLTVTSPPYDNLRDYNGYEFDFEPIAKQLYRVTKVGGVVVWVVGDATINGSETGTSFRQALGFMKVGFRLFQTLHYDKNQGGPPDSTRYADVLEFMFVFSKEKPKAINLICDKPNLWAGTTNWGNRTVREKSGELTPRKDITVADFGKRTSVWRYANGKGFSSKDRIASMHPAIFPESLARDHITSWSNPRDLILDPMVGSGTTAKLAYQLQRNYLGFDISQDYVDLAKKRLLQTQPPLPIEV